MKTLHRIIWYFVFRLFLILTVFMLCVFVFYYAMNASNINIVLKDGMAKRAQVIMMNESSDELSKFFEDSYLQLDLNVQNAINNQSPYLYYTVRGIDHRLTLSYFWCWPWDSTAKVTFIERIPGIDGRVNSQYTDAAKALYGDSYQNPPAWQSGKYNATMIKKNNRWYIRSISLIEVLDNE